jgi:radical SAM superfamily enzyme YgiQ (UPF0313 family)
MKFKIYFADLTHTGMTINANNFPLGVGLVAAYASQEFNDNIEMSIYKYPEELDQALREETPHVLCMSNYSWNANLTYIFAEQVKRHHPEVVVIFGGPNFPLNRGLREAFLVDRPAIDFYIKWDGELAFTGLMQKLIEHDLDIGVMKSEGALLDNTCYLTSSGYVEGPDHRVPDLTVLPSPYLMGLFDKFFDDNLIPMMETTRGCPYSCTFCNDGSLVRSRVYRRSEDVIRQDLEYIASISKNTLQTQFTIVDLNFGMYKEDLATARMIRSTIEEYGWPGRLHTAMGKSHPERLLEVVRIINEGGKGVIKLQASFQSTDTDVLKEIKRKNLSVDDLLGMSEFRYDQINDNQEFLTELILALPGDTLKKHYASLRDVIDVLGMNNIDIHQLTLLMGSDMADWAVLGTRPQDQFDVRHRVFVGCLGIYNVLDDVVPVAELEEVVVGNSTLPFEDYLECRIIDLLVKTYIERDPFNYTFGLIRHLKLSSFDLLLHVREHWGKFQSLSKLTASFIEGSTAPLFDDHDELVQFVSNLENMEKYINGEYGQNELLVHRVKAYMECGTDLHLALRDAALSYIDSHGMLTEDVKEYIEQGVEFSRLTRFDLDNYRTATEGEFNFDFLKAEQLGYEVDPGQLKVDSFRITASYDDGDLATIQRVTELWGTETLHQIGKLFQKHNMLRMRRSIIETSSDASLTTRKVKAKAIE